MQHRELCSGGETSIQMSDEVKSCSQEEREAILGDLKESFKVEIPTNFAVALKADKGITWSRLRDLRR